MEPELRVLHLEDNLDQAEWVAAALRRDGTAAALTRVASRGEFEAALGGGPWDLILAEYILLGYGGAEALAAARARRPEVPFIFVSGTLGEDRALELLKAGATDYVLKGQLARLAPCVRRALAEAAERAGRRRAEAELRRNQEQLRHLQKIEDLSRLAGGVAHDFNNILTAILGYCEALSESLPQEDPRRKDLAEVREATERGLGLTRQLLAFSRRQALQPKVLELNAVLFGMKKMLQRLLGEEVRLAAAFTEAPLRLWADLGQLEQVILNLAVNARDAMPKGGTLTLATGSCELDGAACRSLPGLQPGRFVRLEVRDTGCGMEAGQLQRIFEPYFTTKPEGTGLGLATCYGIVAQCGGSIEVESEPGKGTAFRIYLPEVDTAAAPEAGAPAATLRGAGSETVLVAEDERAVRTLLVRTLKAEGYRILEAKDGAEALRICEEFQGPIDLLLADAVMPRLRGSEVAAQAARRRPGLKVLILSGYLDADLEALPPRAQFIAKPCLPSEVARKVRELLDGGA